MTFTETNKKAHPQGADRNVQVENNTELTESQLYDLRKRMILEVLGTDRAMTAREIADELGFVERNSTAPRLSELEERGVVEKVGKKFDKLTRRMVTVYRRVIE